jgi:Ni,Fe-hydrogenase III small subunit
MRNGNSGRPATWRAVSVLAVETGGCGACAESVAALQSSQYAAELEAQRITFVQSPRQANVVLLSGPFAARAEMAVRRVLDLVMEPQALVSIGDCAINGCVFAGSPEIAASASEALDVHVELPGCPPTPASILNAIARAAELLAESADLDEEAEEDEEAGEDEEDGDEDESEAPPEAVEESDKETDEETGGVPDSADDVEPKGEE